MYPQDGPPLPLVRKNVKKKQERIVYRSGILGEKKTTYKKNICNQYFCRNNDDLFEFFNEQKIL